MDYNLTAGAVSSLMRGEDLDAPIFQILGFKKIAGQGGNDRYRLNISDGTHSHTFAMLATQLNHMIPDGKLDNFCVIRADKLISNSVSEKRVLIILDLTVIAKGTDVNTKIGSPVQWSEQNAAPSGNPPPSNVRTSAAPLNQSNVNSGVGSGAFYGAKPTNGHNNVPPPPKVARPAANPSVNSSSDFGNIPILPIRDLTPFNSKCGIKARVTNKTPIKTWSNSRGEGKLFSLDLLDDSAEIRLTGFNQAVDQFYEMLELNRVYIFNKFSVKNANKNFTNIPHDYELSFVNDSQVSLCTDDTSDVPEVKFNFWEIASIEAAEKDSILDIVGVCKQRGDLQTITAKATNREIPKRDITLVDKTQKEISVTLWGKTAEDFNDDSQPVVVVKGAKVSDFNGKSLSVQMSSLFLINPDIPEAHILRGWYDNEGINIQSQSISVGRNVGGGGAVWKMLQEVNSADPNFEPEKGDYFMSKVTVMSIKRENALYQACPAPSCNKKVVDNNNGLYRCEKCNKEYPDFKFRLMLQVNFADCSDFVWATCFQEHSETILKQTSDVLGPMNRDDPESFDGIVKEAVFQNFICKFRGRVETYNNESRKKISVVDLHPVNYVEYSQKLLAEITECTG